MNPLISIVLPTFNSSQTLPLSLSSVLAQTYENWECIIIDDGSTDNTAEIINIFRDQRFRYYRYLTNRGRGFARQLGLENAKGEFLCLLDSDDWMYPDKLNCQLKVFKKLCFISLVSTGVAYIDQNNELIGVKSYSKTDKPRVYGPYNSLKRPNVCHASCLVKMSDAKEASYDTTLRFNEDKDFLLRLLQGKHYCVIPQIKYAYRKNHKLILKKVLKIYVNERKLYKKYRSTYPIYSNLMISQSYLKTFFYFFIKMYSLTKLIESRNIYSSNDVDKKSFLSAKDQVLDIYQKFTSSTYF